MDTLKVKSRAYGLNINEVDIVVVDDNPGMVKILMTILSSFKVKRARYYTSAEQALTEMIAEPPHILITDWIMNPIDGLDMLQTMRNKAMHPLCNTAIIILTGEPSRKNMASAIENAASYFMVKPISPCTLLERLKWVCSDDRDYVFEGDQMVIKGQKTNIRADKRESPLPEPLVIDFVKAAENGVEPALRKVYEEVPVAQKEEELICIDEFEGKIEGAMAKEKPFKIQDKNNEDDEDIDWIDSNFTWAF